MSIFFELKHSSMNIHISLHQLKTIYEILKTVCDLIVCMFESLPDHINF
jgi:hypothetical protein